ncbi:MAG: hypothetical protein ACLFWD_03905, partial [Anaerolineales bacterium]
PVYYGVIFVLATLTFWRHSPVGILALMVLCGGDGFADIIGRRWGKRKLPWAPGKSWIGSLAMFLASLTFGLIMVFAFDAWGYFHLPLGSGSTVIAIIAIALVATAVESLPLDHVDNITVFLAGLLTAWLLVFPADFWQVPFWG